MNVDRFVNQFDRPTGLKEFSEAARLDPNLTAAHYNLGRFFFGTGKDDDASREPETAVRLQPDSADAVYSLALTRKQENAPDRYTDLLRKVVALQPANANAHICWGKILSTLATGLERFSIEGRRSGRSESRSGPSGIKIGSTIATKAADHEPCS